MRVIGLVFLTIFTWFSVASAETKLAYVDMQRALLETDDGKNAKKQLEKMKKVRQSQLDSKQKNLRKMQKELEAQKAFMKEDVLRAKQMEFGKKLKELQMIYATLQKELAAEEAKLTKVILERMGRILMAVGRKSGDIFILEKNDSRILWAPAKYDLTNELIRRYNAGEGRGGKAKKKSKKKAKKSGKKKKK